jgi:thioredoxin-related protein
MKMNTERSPWRTTLAAAAGLFAWVVFPAAAAAESFDDSSIMHIAFPAWFDDSPFLDLSEEIASAEQIGKQGLMVLFTTEGCYYCARFIDKSLGDPEIAAQVQQHFHSLGMEIFDDKELTDPAGDNLPIKDFAKREGVQFSPSILFYDTEGRRILRLVGYQAPERFRHVLSYLTGRHYLSETPRQYFQRPAAQADAQVPRTELRADPLFSQPPYMLDRSRFPSNQPLLVIFEERGCPPCRDFHAQVLADREVRAHLQRVEVVRLDASDTETPILSPQGERVTPADWYGQTEFTRLPALLFFDNSGRQVLQTDALVLQQRMMNSLNYVDQGAYDKGWTYQRFAREQALERMRRQQGSQ